MTSDQQAQFDVFISYARRDNADRRIQRLADRLTLEFAKTHGRPLRLFFDAVDIEGMEDWRHRILAGLSASQVLVACLSPEYLASDPCQWEFDEFQKHDFAGDGVAPLYLADVPGWLRKGFEEKAVGWIKELRRRQYFDLRNCDFVSDGAEPGSAFDQFCDKLRERIGRGEIARSSPGNVNARNPNFVGRSIELRRVREAVEFGSPGTITVLHGLGGIGKTELATAFAHSDAHHFGGGRWQARCEDVISLGAAVAALSGALGLVYSTEPRADPWPQVEEVLAKLKAKTLASEAPRCLVILDAADRADLFAPADLQRFPANDWLRILVTSRLGPGDLPPNPALAFVALDELPASDALTLIEVYQPQRRFAGEADRQAASEIVALLGGYTLCIEAAAAHLGGAVGDVTCQEFLVRLKREGLAGLETATGGTVRVRHREALLSATLAPTIQRLSEREKCVLELAMSFPLTFILKEWVRLLAGKHHPELKKDPEPGYPDPWRRTLQRLLTLRLVRPAADHSHYGELLGMHQAVHAALRLPAAGDSLKLREDEVSSHADHLASMALSSRWSAHNWGPVNAYWEAVNAALPVPRWHPRAAEFVRHLTPDIDVFRFPCCGKEFPADGFPSQHRLDGCAVLGETTARPERLDPDAMLARALDEQHHRSAVVRQELEALLESGPIEQVQEQVLSSLEKREMTGHDLRQVATLIEAKWDEVMRRQFGMSVKEAEAHAQTAYGKPLLESLPLMNARASERKARATARPQSEPQFPKLAAGQPNNRARRPLSRKFVIASVVLAILAVLCAAAVVIVS